MISSAFELGEEIDLHKVTFPLCPFLWEKFTDKLNIDKWNCIKYLNDEGVDFNTEIDKLPDDKGGIYIFIIKSPVLPYTSEYLAYIGRAKLTDSFSLKVRCKNYLTKYSKDEERPKITRMFKYWNKYLYLKFIEIEENITTVDIEKKLIKAILPPFNDFIPDFEIRQGVKAFS